MPQRLRGTRCPHPNRMIRAGASDVLNAVPFCDARSAHSGAGPAKGRGAVLTPAGRSRALRAARVHLCAKNSAPANDSTCAPRPLPSRCDAATLLCCVQLSYTAWRCFKCTRGVRAVPRTARCTVSQDERVAIVCNVFFTAEGRMQRVSGSSMLMIMSGKRVTASLQPPWRRSSQRARFSRK
jgi:hypothetical protein